MEINSVTDNYSAVNATGSASAAKASSDVEAKAEDRAVDSTKDTGAAASFEKSDEEAAKKSPYKINKMSSEERTALVNQLKMEQETRQNQLKDLVAKMLGQQANTFANANDMWEILSSGKFEVDEATKTQAQADIAEDGYWGVKETSQRMFDFAAALAGDDVDKMKEMQEAMKKGYEQAEKTWGRELPEISKKTMEAANKLFEDYYAANGQQ